MIIENNKDLFQSLIGKRPKWKKQKRTFHLNRSFYESQVFHNSEQILNTLKLESEIKHCNEKKLPFFSILDTLKECKRQPYLIWRNFLSGIIMGMLSIPTSMAYSLMVDLPVEVGVYTSIFAMIIYSLTGTGKQIIVGATSTSFFIVSQLMQGEELQEKLNEGFFLAFTMGFIFILLGIFRMQFITSVYSVSSLDGYFLAASLVIGLQQVIKIMGIHTDSKYFPVQVYELFDDIGSINVAQTIGGVICCIILGVCKYLKLQKFPKNNLLTIAPLFVLIGSILIVHLPGLDSKYNIQVASNMPKKLPNISYPFKDLDNIQHSLFNAIKLAIVNFSEGYVITKALSMKFNYTTSVQNEFFALGLGNIFSSFFGCFPSSSSIVRSPINAALGASNQLSGLFSALFILIAIVFLQPWLKLIPLFSVYSLVLVTLIANLIQVKEISFIYKFFRKDFYLYVISFLLCVIFSLADGIIISVLISLIWLLKRSAKPIWTFKQYEELMNEQQSVSSQDPLSPNYQEDEHFKRKKSSDQVVENFQKELIGMKENLCFCFNTSCKKEFHVMIISLLGNLTYISAEKMKIQAEYISSIEYRGLNNKIKLVLYEFERVSSLDLTQSYALKQIIQLYQKNEIQMGFAQVSMNLQFLMQMCQFPQFIIDDCDISPLLKIMNVYKKIYDQKNIEICHIENEEEEEEENEQYYDLLENKQNISLIQKSEEEEFFENQSDDNKKQLNQSLIIYFSQIQKLMSYGWLTESTILPKKQQQIKVNDQSIIELENVIELQKQKQQGINFKKIQKNKEKQNSGVLYRNQKDIDQVKESKNYVEKLRKKAILYEKIKQNPHSYDQEKYLVNFSQKQKEDEINQLLKRNNFRSTIKNDIYQQKQEIKINQFQNEQDNCLQQKEQRSLELDQQSILQNELPNKLSEKQLIPIIHQEQISIKQKLATIKEKQKYDNEKRLKDISKMFNQVLSFGSLSNFAPNDIDLYLFC